MEKLERLLMIRRKVVSRTLIGAELVDDRLKTVIHALNRLSRLLCEFLIFAPVSLKQSCFDSSCALVLLCELGPDLAGRLEMAHTLVLLIAEADKQNVDGLVIPLILRDGQRLCTLSGNNIGRILGDTPYVAALTQEIHIHA